jgi:ABC-type thiamin/hydroxymethylpyrimidine transport system permease subunit
MLRPNFITTDFFFLCLNMILSTLYLGDLFASRAAMTTLLPNTIYFGININCKGIWDCSNKICTLGTGSFNAYTVNSTICAPRGSSWMLEWNITHYSIATLVLSWVFGIVSATFFLRSRYRKRLISVSSLILSNFCLTLAYGFFAIWELQLREDLNNLIPTFVRGWQFAMCFVLLLFYYCTSLKIIYMPEYEYEFVN